MHCSTCCWHQACSAHCRGLLALKTHKALHNVAVKATPEQATYTVRLGQVSDVPRLAAVEQLCSEFSAQWSTADIQDELDREISCMLVAAESDTDNALGYIVGWLIAGELQVLELAIDPAHQGKGIGSALLAALIEECRCDADSVVVLLEVKALNMKAIQLYMKYGFVEVGLRRKYYDDGSDALLMARQPGQGLLLPAKP